MPRVPRYEQAPIQQQGIQQAKVSPDAPAEAFGLGAASFDKLQKTAMGVLENEKKNADQTAVLEADRLTSELQTKIQLQASQRKGKDAITAPDLINDEWTKGVEKIRGNLRGSDQLSQFERTTASRYNELNKSISFHVRGQMEEHQKNEEKASIDNSRDQAVLNAGDDEIVNNNIRRQQWVIEYRAQREGYSGTEREKAEIQEAVSATHKGVIAARIDAGGVGAAQAYYEKNKDKFTAQDHLHVTKALEDGQVLVEGKGTWEKVKSMTLQDGNPDEEKMRAHIMAQSDLSDARKEKVWGYVKARAGEYIANKTRADAGRDREFQNSVIDLRKNGAAVDDALKLATKFGTDGVDTAVKQDYVRKMYAPPTVSDPAMVVNLYERIDQGGATKQEIDKALLENKINPGDWKSLRERHYNMNTDPLQKAAWDHVRSIAKDKIGNDPMAINNFLYEMRNVGTGKSPEELTKMATDRLKDSPGSGIFGSNWFADQQYKVDVRKRDAKNLGWGVVHEDVGRAETNAIGASIMRAKKSKDFDIADVDAFAKELGGYDQIRQGQPANKAIRYLMNEKVPVTPANIKYFLERYPDGVK